MHRAHLALSNRPEPEVLARRWFTYIVTGVAAMIIGIVTLMSSPNRAATVRSDQQHVGTLGPAATPADAVPAAPPNPHLVPD